MIAPCDAADVLHLTCEHHAKTIEDLQQQLIDMQLQHHLSAPYAPPLDEDAHQRALSGDAHGIMSPLEGSQRCSMEGASKHTSVGDTPESWNTDILSRRASSSLDLEQRKIECPAPGGDDGSNLPAPGGDHSSMPGNSMCVDPDAREGEDACLDGRRHGGRIDLSYLNLQAANMSATGASPQSAPGSETMHAPAPGDASVHHTCNVSSAHHDSAEAAENPRAFSECSDTHSGNTMGVPPSGDGNKESAGAAAGRHDGSAASQAVSDDATGRLKECAGTMGPDGQRNSWGLGASRARALSMFAAYMHVRANTEQGGLMSTASCVLCPVSGDILGTLYASA
jgi:hypothetical protein